MCYGYCGRNILSVNKQGDTVSADTEALAQLLAKKFVQQKLVKAIQTSDGGYRPIRTNYPNGDFVKWVMRDFRDHINGTHTYGHYTSDAEGLTKLITFDLDLRKEGTYCTLPDKDFFLLPPARQTNAEFDKRLQIIQSHPRDDWHDRKHPARGWYKQQLRSLCEWISSTAHKDLGFQVACAYSGNKGCHVYCFFPEPVPTGIARESAFLILEATAERIMSGTYRFASIKGNSFYRFTDPDPYTGFENIDIEVYPKQDEALGDKLGNLVRLPLGVNLKNPKDPCFILDQRVPYSALQPHPNPVEVLSGRSPWE